MGGSGADESRSAEPRHGTTNCYKRHRCRCPECRAAKARERAVQNARALRALGSNPSDPRHGTTTGYRAGCRCPECRAAKAEWSRGYYARASAESR